MRCKAQVSMEYLLTILFGVILAIIVAIMALNLTQIADIAKTKILAYRDDAISSFMGG